MKVGQRLGAQQRNDAGKPVHAVPRQGGDGLFAGHGAWEAPLAAKEQQPGFALTEGESVVTPRYGDDVFIQPGESQTASAALYNLLG